MKQTVWIADSGSTKTDWAVCPACEAVYTFQTPGINPFMQTAAEIVTALREGLADACMRHQPDVVYFYGAGCRDAACAVVAEAISSLCPQAQVHVHADLLGAARALFGRGDGVACILGTGSNSCLYLDGQIAGQVPPLGYVLGDEGSGAVLGRRLLGDVLKRQLPAGLCAAFSAQYGLTAAEVLERVYRGAFPNRFLASFAPFLSAHHDEEAVRQLLHDEFLRFFRRNVCMYERPDLPVSFVGGVAAHFHDDVWRAASACGLKVGQVLARPLVGLVRFHVPGASV